jgi:hypothetical protein
VRDPKDTVSLRFPSFPDGESVASRDRQVIDVGRKKHLPCFQNSEFDVIDPPG